MEQKWPTLNNPPVVAALFQLRFNPKEVRLDDFLTVDKQLKHTLPNQTKNIQVGLDLGGTSIPLGVSPISGTSDAKIGSYIYFSVDQKVKLEISENAITYIDESPYKNWDDFKMKVLKLLSILSDVLNKVEITRTSIRFINRFTFKEFDHPEEYFNTLISSNRDEGLPYPLQQYGFKLVMVIPDRNIYTMVNQNVENIRSGSFIYTFDIDVIDRQNLIFNIDTLSMNMEELRSVKNTIFFDNVTQKTLDLCN